MCHSDVRAYERKTREILSRFVCHRLTFPECISALDAELSNLLLRIAEKEIPRLRVMLLANLARVHIELERRGGRNRE